MKHAVKNVSNSDGKALALPGEWGNPPADSSKVLMMAIKENGASRQVACGHEISYEESLGKVFFIETGSWVIGMNDSAVVGHLNKGAVFGVGNIFEGESPVISLQAIDNSLFYECGIDKIKNLMTDWRISLAVAEHLAWCGRLITIYLGTVMMGDAYTKVKFAIEWLVRSASVYKRKTSLVQFVTDRTGISKGHAHAILKQLRGGGYIEMEAGCLVRICKDLPMEY